MTFPGGAVTKAGPSVDTTLRSASTVGARGFDGINAADSRLARDGNQFTNAPPDGALCEGSGAALQVVNSALQFSSAAGNLLTAPIALSSFYGLPAEIDRSTNPLTFPGPSLGDPRCLFDPATGRLMVLAWGLGQDPVTAAPTGTNTYYLAVQATADPLGAYFRYAIAVDAPGSPGCQPGCEADFPMIGADANTVVISWNSFHVNKAGVGTAYNGGRLIALSKAKLTTGLAVQSVLYKPGSIGGQPVYTLQPAGSPPGGAYDARKSGTAWLLGSVPSDNGDNRVVLAALTGTSRIDTAGGHPTLQLTLVGVSPYTQPPELQQKPGPRPLGAHLHDLFGAPNEPLAKLDPGPDKASSVEWAAGRLWTSISTGVAGSSTREGQLLLAISPGFSGFRITGSVAAQRYLSVAGASLAYGDIAVTADGKSAAVVASLTGPSVYPSAVLGRVDPTTLKSAGLSIYKAGVAPEDSFSCYAAFGGGPCRWGDYSEINVGDDGAFHMETVYVSSRPRIALASWATAVGRLPIS